MKKFEVDPLTPKEKKRVDPFDFMSPEMKEKVVEGLESLTDSSDSASTSSASDSSSTSSSTDSRLIANEPTSHGRYIDQYEECGQEEQTIYEPVFPDQFPDQLPGRFVADDEECGPNETAVWVPANANDQCPGQSCPISEEDAAMELVEEFLVSNNATETDELLKKDANKAESAFNVLPSYGKYGYNGNQKVEKAESAAASVSSSMLLTIAAAALTTLLL
jgi:hypothetical protein